MSDLLDIAANAPTKDSYTAQDIEVLEGLEPVRRRPGMYIGGTDERALHHLVAEVLDNAMDEAVAGHANRIEIELESLTRVTVRDNGRGIPVDPHPKFPDKSALEVIMTTLHSGGKFGSKAYATSGGLHGVGVSVVNALAEELKVEVARNRTLWAQSYSRGAPLTPLEAVGQAPNRRGTTITFVPDPEIFGTGAKFKPETLYRLARSKAYLFRGVEIRWSCAADLVADGSVPARETFHFPAGLTDFLKSLVAGRELVADEPFAGLAELEDQVRVEWAVAWPINEEGYTGWYCNTVPTPLGGTHEQGLRTGLLKAVKNHAERVGHKRAAQITADDLTGGAAILLSIFIRQPQFQGQTKERLVSPEASRLVENVLRDRFELWLGSHAQTAMAVLDHLVARAEERIARKKAKEEVGRKSATRKLRLPGKLADCSRDARDGTEIFIVEGDSAGGSAKQARSREIQAILPLRGKILNVASATADKLSGNKELSDLVTALGCGSGKSFRGDDLRYERIIIMTDADVDGAHIAALLMTFFHREMPKLIERGHLFLAQPPLYRLSHGATVAYARDEADRERILNSVFKGKKNVEVGRFKGLGEMNPAQLKETTMDPARRQILQVQVGDVDSKSPSMLVEELMGRRPELRLAFIQNNAKDVGELDV
ncbi:MAG: DNA topoisomerase IV subunit B [Geminicoccaceae bacterium]